MNATRPDRAGVDLALRPDLARRPSLYRSLIASGLLTAVAAATVTACSGSSPAGGMKASPAAADRTAAASVQPTVPGSPSAANSANSRSPSETSAGSSPTDTPTASAGPLSGKVVLIDPGHNGGNGTHSAQIARIVNTGNGSKECDTTGTETNAGYTESAFTFDVSTRLAGLLRAQGATVVLTRPNDSGVGPCITERAAIGNRVHANAAISIHADGAPASGYGFHVILPERIGLNDAIVVPARQLGVDVRDAFRSGTGEPLSTYAGTGTGGLVTRSDLGGLNLSAVPKVFIECGNMRNASDATRLTSADWRQLAAASLAAGLTRYLRETG